VINLIPAQHAYSSIPSLPSLPAHFEWRTTITSNPDTWRLSADATVANLPAVTGKGTILMVDDEPAVRAIVGRILVDAGYDVVPAADGQEALNLYQRSGPFAIVLLDESMPGLPGRAVLERLLALDPAAKVVLFTGYGPEAAELRGAAGVLEKPVAMDTLLQFLGRVLDSGGASARPG
jgi:CheY-like chemotaxis protein